MSVAAATATPSKWAGWPELIVRWRRAVIVVTLLVTALALYQAGKIRLVIDMNATLPQTHRYIAATNDVERVFGAKYVVVVGVTPARGDIYQPAVLDKVRRIHAAIAATPGILADSMASIAARRAKSIGDANGDLQVRPLMPAGPATPASAAALRSAVAMNPVFQDGVVSRDGRTASIIAEFKEPPAGFRSILDRIEAIANAERDGATDIAVGGLPSYLAAVEHYSERMAVLLPVAIVVLALCLYAGFRTRQGPLLPLATALIAVIWGVGLMGFLGVPLDVFNATTPILILAVATGHAVQMLKRFYEEFAVLRAAGLDPRAANTQAVVVAMRRVGPVMLAAGTVAALGFFSLMVFEISTVRTFGLFTGIGILAALVLELSFIPAVRASLAPPADSLAATHASGIGARVSARIAHWVCHRRGAIYAGFALLAVLALLGMRRIVVDNSVKSFFADSTAVSRQDRLLNDRLGGTNTVYLLVEGPAGSMKEPRNLKAIDALEGFLASEPQVGKTVSIAYFVKQLNQAMHGGDARYFRVPDDTALVAQYLMLYSLSGAPDDFDSYVDSDYAKANLTVFFKTDSSARVETLIARVNAFAAGRFAPGLTVRFGGSVPQSAALSEVMVRDKLLNIAQIAAVVFLIAALVFRSLVGGLLVLLPLLVAVLVNFGLMGWSGILLNVPTSLTAAMAVGIGADYAIYLIYRLREELAGGGDAVQSLRRVIGTAGQAILFVAVAVAAGYGVLLLSFGFKVHQWLAILIAAAMMVSAFAALLLIPALLLTFRPRFIFSTQP